MLRVFFRTDFTEYTEPSKNDIIKTLKVVKGVFIMPGFMSLLQTIRKEAFTERDKGTRFERLICNYLKTSRKYSELLDSVWMWENFPFRKDFGGKDTGIDLVAKTKTNEY